MGNVNNVDAVPVASQLKSVVQASRGDREAAWQTQRRFTQQCIGASQVRSLVEASRGDMEAAAETQRQFLETSRRVLGRNEVFDAVPGVAQLKASALRGDGEAVAAAETQRNFWRRCPVVSQVRSVHEALVENKKAEAVERQREFLRFASVTMDKVPLVGHAKGWVHHALGEHERAGQSIQSANQSFGEGVKFMKMAYGDITNPSSSTSAGVYGEEPASVEPAGPLTEAEIRQSTLSFMVEADQCSSFTACPVCMEDFKEGDWSSTLRCFHIFHVACADKWLSQSGNCPVCRVQVNPTASGGRASSSSS